MKLYTKTGDDGTTGLFGGARVGKDDLRVEAYGTLDEANSLLGVARAANPPEEVSKILERVQAELFNLGAELACAPGKEKKLGMPKIDASHIQALEGDIDTLEAVLPPLRAFILPGGSPSAASLHHARSVCRRAERGIIALARQSPLRDELVIYLNRLSDLLFALARRCNQAVSLPDVEWR